MTWKARSHGKERLSYSQSSCDPYLRVYEFNASAVPFVVSSYVRACWQSTESVCVSSGAHTLRPHCSPFVPILYELLHVLVSGYNALGAHSRDPLLPAPPMLRSSLSLRVLQIGNRIKAKGLQKLRWYCQMCQKQCRDENGFKCHLTSDSHRRQMELFGQNPHRIVEGYSEEFHASFMEHLRRACVPGPLNSPMTLGCIHQCKHGVVQQYELAIFVYAAHSAPNGELYRSLLWFTACVRTGTHTFE